MSGRFQEDLWELERGVALLGVELGEIRAKARGLLDFARLFSEQEDDGRACLTFTVIGTVCGGTSPLQNARVAFANLTSGEAWSSGVDSNGRFSACADLGDTVSLIVSVAGFQTYSLTFAWPPTNRTVSLFGGDFWPECGYSLNQSNYVLKDWRGTKFNVPVDCNTGIGSAIVPWSVSTSTRACAASPNPLLVQYSIRAYWNATCFAQSSGGVLTGVTICDGGLGYTSPPTCGFNVSAGGTQPVVTPAVSGGKVVGFTVVSGGSNVTNGAQVSLSQPDIPTHPLTISWANVSCPTASVQTTQAKCPNGPINIANGAATSISLQGTPSGDNPFDPTDPEAAEILAVMRIVPTGVACSPFKATYDFSTATLQAITGAGVTGLTAADPFAGNSKTVELTLT